jgi:hypothetical protein
MNGKEIAFVSGIRKRSKAMKTKTNIKAGVQKVRE